MEEQDPGMVIPSDVLIVIFSNLPARDVLRGARAVCRQWRDVALHQEVWQHVDLVASGPGSVISDGDTDNTSTAATVFNLVPCLRRLVVDLDTLPEPVVKMAMGTQCRVAELDVRASKPLLIKPTLLILHNQLKESGVRRLRRLALSFSRRAVLTMDSMRALWEQQVEELVVPKLCELTVRSGSFTLPNLPPLEEEEDAEPTTTRTTTRPQSRTTRLRLNGVMHWELKNAMVKCAAASLLSVSLGGRKSAQAVTALGSCELLREASVPAVKEVEHLNACRQLASLTLWLDGDCREHAEGLHAFFVEGGTWLRRLTLVFSKKDAANNTELVADLLKALSASGCAALEELYLDANQSALSSDAILDNGTMLAGLPRLRVLRLMHKMPSEALVASLTPWRVPRLCVLDLGRSCHFSPRRHQHPARCPVPSYVAILKVNPRLHIVGADIRLCELGPRSCGSGENACCHVHRSAESGAGPKRRGVFAHRSLLLCELCRSLEKEVTWAKVHVQPATTADRCRRCKSGKPPPRFGGFPAVAE